MFKKQSDPYVISPGNVKEIEKKRHGDEGAERLRLFQVTNIPEFFIIPTITFDHFIESAGITDTLIHHISQVQPFIESTAQEASDAIQETILNAQMPSVILNPIKQAYENISETPVRPLIRIIPSYIFQEEKFIPDKKLFFEMTQGSFEEIEMLVKQGWASLFTAEALELRTNQYYQGNLSIALVCQRIINAESTGTTFAANSNEIITTASYGLQTNEENSDRYSYNPHTRTFKERFIQKQEKMVVRTRSLQGDQVKEVTLSSDWAKRQKVQDDLLHKIIESFQNISSQSEYNKILWGIEAGKVYFLDFETIPEEQNIQVEKQQKENSKKEETVIPKKKLEIKPLVPKSKSINIDTNIRLKKRQLVSKQFLDVTPMNSSIFNQAENLDGKFFDGTEIVLEKAFLPEEKFTADNIAKATKFIKASATTLTTVARVANSATVIYKMSDIGDEEQKLLAVDRNDYNHDERFIQNPEALIVESQIIKTVRNSNGMKNVSVLIPKSRSVQNISVIKRILAEQGLRRSKSFKMYAEIAFPSLVSDISNITLQLIDGIFINVEQLITLHTYRSIIREQDWETFTTILEFIVSNKAKEVSLNMILSTEVPNEILTKIIQSSVDIIIWKDVPTNEKLSIIDETESKQVTQLVKPGRKQKPLFKLDSV